MARHVDYSRLPVVVLFILLSVHLANAFVLPQVSTKSNSTISRIDLSSIRILPVSESNVSKFGILAEVNGTNLHADLQLIWSVNEKDCEAKNELRKVQAASDAQRVVYEFQDNRIFEVNVVYFCTKYVTSESEISKEWINLGKDFSVHFKSNELYSRSRREYNEEKVAKISNNTFDFHIRGIRIETSDKHTVYGDDGVPEILAGNEIVLRLFGVGITEDIEIAFTNDHENKGALCDKRSTDKFSIYKVEENTALVSIVLSKPGIYYLCANRRAQETDIPVSAVHQGSDNYLTIRAYEKSLPLWVSIIIILTCLSFSALFSGLNLGLMSLDRTELKILCNTGTEKEKQYARTIEPVRNMGNYLLCSILFSNVLVNSIFTIVLEELTSGQVAVICATLAIVIFGEISPQAICSRHGLCIGAKTIYMTKLTMILTFPLSYPISKLLDLVLGEEIGNVYNRERLKELVKVTTGFNDLEKEEVNIISGALELCKKTVADVMTRIDDVYMLDYNAILDFETVSEILKSGFSRIPVYEETRNNIVSILYIKDLAFVDPDDNKPLKTLCEFYKNPCNFVFEDVTLDVMFKQFKEGHKGHMAFVQRVNSEGEGDPFYEVIGLVTLEDVIEELIQAEIMDETDVITDNRSKRKRVKSRMQDFTVFAEKNENQRTHVSPQLMLALFQFLSTIESFKSDIISENILRRLLKHDVIYYIKVKSREKARHDPVTIIYQQNKAADYFVLILEGRVEVTLGKENMTFESGPFTYFGTQALAINVSALESPVNVNPQSMGSIHSVNLNAIARHTFIPDYTVRAVTEVFYVKIKRSLYLAAKRATLLERSQKDISPSTDQFDDEVEKLLHSLDEDDRSAPESPILPKDKGFGDVEEQTQTHTPIHKVTTLPALLPVSASPITNSKFISPHSEYNGKLKTSPIKVTSLSSSPERAQIDVKGESVRLLPERKSLEDGERTNLLPNDDKS
ncbi:unextended protein isoform X1 [Leptopilina heterotoma]|uniref:unextended protein isoform X1 n=1 Tax=Leptopilina heterotoma TaxID=63436 RepID=UPI001CA82F5B|nr:unextended protein isoform X1 [Leptopilina heterotoma]